MTWLRWKDKACDPRPERRYFGNMSTALVYLDHAATTPVRAEVREAMLPYLGGEMFGNPSSSHRFGRAVRAGVEQARREVAAALEVSPEEVVFTSGGTEADNLAVLGACLRARAQGRRMRAAVAVTEHKAVLAAAHEVKHLGGEEVLLPVDADGLLDLGALDTALAERPTVASVMWVNNETGVIQAVAEIAGRCRAAGTLFHSDLVQAFGKVPVSVRGAGVDLASISAHKIGGPKGVGALIVRDRSVLEPLQHGGSQQWAVRPGTENVAGIVGLGRAAALAAEELGTERHRLRALRDELIARVSEVLPDCRVSGAGAPRAPHVVNLQIPGADGESLLAQLDLAGVAAAGGSACTTGSVEPSHVLTAMGIPRDRAIGAIRLSLGRDNRADDVATAVEALRVVVRKNRRLTTELGRAG
jgi:cysteine desulfurase